MRRFKTLIVLATLLAVALALAGCASSADTTGTPSSDESAVPAGMPVMYEFYTTS